MIVLYTESMANDNYTPFQISLKKQEPAPEPVSVKSPLGGSLSGRKAPEAEPIPAVKPEVKVNEESKEKNLAPEVIEYVQQHEEKVKIPEALKQIGVVADAKDHEIEEVVEGPKLPMTDQQIVDGLKKPMSMSAHWLSLFLLYILQQAHYTIKVIHGSVKRIVKP